MSAHGGALCLASVCDCVFATVLLFFRVPVVCRHTNIDCSEAVLPASARTEGSCDIVVCVLPHAHSFTNTDTTPPGCPERKRNGTLQKDIQDECTPRRERERNHSENVSSNVLTRSAGRCHASEPVVVGKNDVVQTHPRLHTHPSIEVLSRISSPPPTPAKGACPARSETMNLRDAAY